jgi:hypothetical protein
MPITPAHLVYSHGYEREYADQMDPARREAEHQRLHEDDTAESLDHDHSDALDLAVASAKSSLDHLREVLDDIDVQIGDRQPRPYTISFQVLAEDGKTIAYSNLALMEGEVQVVRMVFRDFGGYPREADVQVSAR